MSLPAVESNKTLDFRRREKLGLVSHPELESAGPSKAGICLPWSAQTKAKSFGNPHATKHAANSSIAVWYDPPSCWNPWRDCEARKGRATGSLREEAGYRFKSACFQVTLNRENPQASRSKLESLSVAGFPSNIRSLSNEIRVRLEGNWFIPRCVIRCLCSL